MDSTVDKQNNSSFRFYGSLNDFLLSAQRDTWIAYGFHGRPAVKDAIEAIGVPHPEVDLILTNGTPADFSYSLQPHDRVEVYPVNTTAPRPERVSLSVEQPAPKKFVLDVHLGKLAKALRMLGFDTCYQNDFSDQAIAAISARENRIVLTRDVGLLKQKTIRWGYWLRSQHPEEQLEEVMRYFGLAGELSPFTRCLACNTPIVEVAKEEVWEKLPPKTRLYFQQFYECPSCRRVYWKGSHYDRMQAFVQRVQRKEP